MTHTDLPTTIAPAVKSEAADLLADYERACDMLRSTSGDYGVAMAEEYADACGDRLASFVDRHDLYDTEFDVQS